MELGGHAPVIILDDVDVDQVATLAAAGKFRNAGQVCISPTRFFVQENSYKKFAERFTEKAKSLKLGDGLEGDTRMGPLANARRLDAMNAIVADTKSRGAKIATGGSRHGNQGYFFEPTVVTDIQDDSNLMTQEPFGPIAPIIPFKSFDEVVARANALPFGLAAYAFTNSTKTANAISDALQSGMVGVNTFAISMAETPFGGIKESGYGHEGSVEGLEAYTNKKFVAQA
jgi:succinate-semialdehyde dehydrogenase/glutarate-semialdehyde dehydrogenase